MGNIMTAVGIAKIVHEANKAYCEMIGDDSHVSWEDAPEWQRESEIDGVEFHMDAIVHGNVVSPRESHLNWLKQKKADGWIYGSVKDVDKKEHPCYVPYNDLPIAQRRKDSLFGAIIASLV